jgi:hypothetical protein
MAISSKKFLVPVAATLAALAAQSEAGQTVTHQSAAELSKNAIAKVVPQAIDPAASIATFQQGDELHGLLLRRSAEGIVVADHYSHRSHASHASHASHYSSRY